MLDATLLIRRIICSSGVYTIYFWRRSCQIARLFPQYSLDYVFYIYYHLNIVHFMHLAFRVIIFNLTLYYRTQRVNSFITFQSLLTLELDRKRRFTDLNYHVNRNTWVYLYVRGVLLIRNPFRNFTARFFCQNTLCHMKFDFSSKSAVKVQHVYGFIRTPAILQPTLNLSELY